MAQKRNFSASTIHHVFNRGADRQDIFTLDVDQLLLEDLIREAFARFDIELHAYVFMSNHFHFLVEIPSGEAMSRAMQWLESRYAQIYNRRSDREGPLFTGRFKNVAVLDDAQFLTTARYIDRNPLEFMSPATLAAYRWGSLAVHSGRRPAPEWLSTRRVSGFHATGEEYLGFVLRDLPSDRLSSHDRTPLRRTTLDEVEAAVCIVSQQPLSDLRQATPGRKNPARLIATALAIETRAASVPELTIRFGYGSASSTRRAAQAGRNLIARSPLASDLRYRTLSALDHSIGRDAA